MAFDPDKFLSTQPSFDPDAFLAKPTRIQKTPSAFESAGAGATNAITLGYWPEIEAAAAPAISKVGDYLTGSNTAPALEGKNFASRREDAARDLERITSANPNAAFAGGLLGVAGTAGLLPAVKGATLGARAASAAKIGGLLGAVQNVQQTEGEYDPFQLETRLQHGLVGAAAGGALQAGGEKLADWLTSGSGGVAETAAKKATRALGRPTPTQATNMARSGEDVAIGRALLDEGAIPVFGTSKAIGQNVERLGNENWQKVEAILNRGGNAPAVSGTEAGLRVLNDPKLPLLRQAGETSQADALEEAANHLANMGDISLQHAQKLKKIIDEQINYNKAIPDMTGNQAARFAKRTALRDQMDETATRLGAGQNELKGALKRQGYFEKAGDIVEREAGRNQANRAIGLTDTIAGVGAAAAAPPGTKELAALAFGALNKAGRTFGNSIQARGYDTIAKAMGKSQALADLIGNNPGGAERLMDRLAAAVTGSDHMKPGEVDPILKDPQMRLLFEQDPKLIDSIQDPMRRASLSRQLQRGPAKGH